MSDLVKKTNNLILSGPITKARIAEAVEAIVSQVNGGYVDELAVYAQLKAVSEIAKTAMDEIKDAAIAELENYPKGDLPHGIGFQVRSGKRRFEYNSLDLKRKEAELERLQDEIKRMKEGLDREVVGYGAPTLAVSFPDE